jgi:hypothetical protein
VTLASTGVLTGDTLTYADTSATFPSKNVANGLAVSVAGITASGTGSGNYTVNGATTTSANITPAIVNLTGSRTYDGLPDANASIFGTAGTVATGVGTETLTLSGSGILVAKNVGVQATSAGTLLLGNGSGLASNYQLSGGSDVVTVTPLGLTVTAAGANKVYDGGTNAAVTLASTGVLAGDSLSYADTSATFANKNVAHGTAVSVAGITESGTGSGNYTVNGSATTSANITPAIVNLTGARSYDGLTDANANIFGAAGTVATGVGAETLALSGSSTLLGKNAGTQGLSALGSLALGNGTGVASNYQLSGGSDVVAVTPIGIIVTAAGVSKVYDGGVTAAVTLASTGVLAGDSLSFADTSATFADKDVANGVPVAVAGITESGSGAGNYTVNGTATTSANITPLALTITASGINKLYDGSVTAGVTLASAGVLSGDSLTYAASTATFANKNVANNVPVTVAGITESGTGSGNYTVNGSAATTANITPAIVNLTGSRSYDGLLDASTGIFGSAGTVATGVGAETLTLSGSSALVSKSAGTQGLSSLGSLTLGNGTGLASNYTLSGGIDVVAVSPLAITVVGTVNNKTYDGTPDATLSGLGSGGVIAGDTVAFTASAADFANKNVGEGKPVSIAGITAYGADAANYRFNASTVTTANVTPATLIETARPISVAAGQIANLNGSLSGFVPGDTRDNATDGALVWLTNATVSAKPGSYSIDGSGLTAENYVLVQSPVNAAALTVTAAPVAMAGTESVYGSIGSYLAPADIATPYGVGSADDYGNNTGNARRDANPVDGNRHLSDFTGRVALRIIGAGIRMPAEAAH